MHVFSMEALESKGPEGGVEPASKAIPKDSYSPHLLFCVIYFHTEQG